MVLGTGLMLVSCGDTGTDTGFQPEVVLGNWVSVGQYTTVDGSVSEQFRLFITTADGSEESGAGSFGSFGFAVEDATVIESNRDVSMRLVRFICGSLRISGRVDDTGTTITGTISGKMGLAPPFDCGPPTLDLNSVSIVLVQ